MSQVLQPAAALQEPGHALKFDSHLGEKVLGICIEEGAWEATRSRAASDS